jgi:pimeloyl-ACP methyl ester carboxylesterase
MQSSFFTANGLTLHVLDWAPALENGAVLLIHGLSSTARVWELVAPGLAEQGLRAVAPDLRGHGLSDRPESGYDFASVTDDLACLAAILSLEKPLVVGHSWGALLALEYAARFAESDICPRGMVLIDGGIVQFSGIPGATWSRVQQVLAPPRWEGMRVDDFKARLRDPARAWQPDDQALDIILSNFIISRDGCISPRVPFARYMEVVRYLWEFQTHKRFAKVRCPVLLLPARPPERASSWERLYAALKEQGVARVREQIPALRVHWMEEAVHDIPLARAEELGEQIMQFAAQLGMLSRADRDLA